MARPRQVRIRLHRAPHLHPDGRPTSPALPRPRPPAPAALIWWTHTLALLIFLPLIPHTKHLHLVLSPATVFLKRDGFSKIPPLEGDEDFGLVTGKDITQIGALQAFSCVECGRCSEHCPATNTGKALNPKEIILGLRSYLERERVPRPKSRSSAPTSPQEAIFQCTTCGACEYQCPVGIQHLPVHDRPAPRRRQYRRMGRRLRHQTLPQPGAQRQFARSRPPASATSSSTKMSCHFMTAPRNIACGSAAWEPTIRSGRETILALVKILRYLDLTFGVMKKEKCTGDPARRLGNDLLFHHSRHREPRQPRRQPKWSSSSPSAPTASAPCPPTGPKPARPSRSSTTPNSSPATR